MTRLKISRRDTFSEKVRRAMKSGFYEYKGAIEGPNKAHLHALGKYKSFWQSVHSDITCFPCLHSGGQIFLPCNHALCELCYRNLGSPNSDPSNLRTSSDPISCTVCPLCGEKWDDFAVRLARPTAGGIALALDGGGVRGLIALHMLTRLYQRINLALPLHCLFELVVGTSTGKQRLN